MLSKEAELKLQAFPCKCGHEKRDHDWMVGSCNSCACVSFIPNDDLEFNRLVKIFRDEA